MGGYSFSAAGVVTVRFRIGAEEYRQELVLAHGTGGFNEELAWAGYCRGPPVSDADLIRDGDAVHFDLGRTEYGEPKDPEAQSAVSACGY